MYQELKLDENWIFEFSDYFLLYYILFVLYLINKIIFYIYSTKVKEKKKLQMSKSISLSLAFVAQKCILFHVP